MKRTAGLVLVLAYALAGCGTNDVAGGDVDASDESGLSDVSDVGGDVEPGDASQTDVDAAATDVESEVTDVAPEFNAAIADTLSKLLLEHVAFSPDPGVSLTVRTADGAWWSGAAGLASIEPASPMTPDSAFRVGSNTKPIVAAVVLQLVEEGLVGLDEPLTKYLPQYEEWSDITVRMLLNMRSGLQDFVAIPACVIDIVLNPTRAVTPDYILDFVLAVDRLFAPDTKGKYTNTNYVLLGLIIEKVTGNPADQEIDARIIRPLGLTATYLDMGGTENPVLADGYIDFGLAGNALGIKPSMASMIPDTTWQNGLLVGTNLMHPTVTWTSGALVSTSGDMAKFVYALMNAGLFGRALVDEMAETQGAELFNGLVPYGLGLQVRDTDYGQGYGHGGLNFGYQAGTYFFPDNGITISHMHNFLIDSYDTFQNDLMKAIVEGGDPEFVPCTAPDGLYRDGTDGKYFNVAFKGTVNPADRQPRVVGTGSFRSAESGEIKPLSGIFPNAALGNSAGVDNVTITGYGLSEKEGVDLTITSVVVGSGLFSGLDEYGRKSIGQANLGDSFVLLADAYYAEGTQNPEKICYVGVSDYMRVGETFVCPGSREFPAVDGTFKMMASLPYSDDETYVGQVLSYLSMSRCNCLSGETWAPCE